MKPVRLQEVIILEEVKRGKGVEGDPIRNVRQIYSKDGELLAEFDPVEKYSVKICIDIEDHTIESK